MATETLAERALAAYRESEALIQQDIERERQERYEQRKTDLAARVNNILGDVPAMFLDPISHPDPDLDGELFPLARVDGLLVSLSPYDKHSLALCRPCPTCGAPHWAGSFGTLTGLGRLLASEAGPCERCRSRAPGGEEKTINETDRLIQSARAAAAQLSDARERVVQLRARLRSVQEAAEIQEARLILSDAYAAGKNAEIRTAWLRLQREQDPDYAGALQLVETVRRELDAAEAEIQRLGYECNLAIEEARLERAYLLARSIEED